MSQDAFHRISVLISDQKKMFQVVEDIKNQVIVIADIIENYLESLTFTEHENLQYDIFYKTYISKYNDLMDQMIEIQNRISEFSSLIVELSRESVNMFE